MAEQPLLTPRGDVAVAEGCVRPEIGRLIGLDEGDTTMAKVAAFHSKRPGDKRVYHDNSSCTEGNNIEPQNKVSGTGGLPYCDHCKRLG